MNCAHCSHPLTACIAASEGMQVRHWWCQGCGRDSRATGREFGLTLYDLRRRALDELTAIGQAMGDYDPVQASIEAFVEMRLEGGTDAE